MTVSISSPTDTDRADWERLYHGYAEFYKVPMNDDILDIVWGWIQDDDNPFYCLFARDRTGQAVGLMHCRRMPSPLRGAQVGFLDDLYVVPEARGGVVVKALYEALNDLAASKGWPFVRWITAEDNYRARSVYDRLSDKTHWVTYQMPVKP